MIEALGEEGGGVGWTREGRSFLLPVPIFPFSARLLSFCWLSQQKQKHEEKKWIKRVLGPSSQINGSSCFFSIACHVQAKAGTCRAPSLNSVAVWLSFYKFMWHHKKKGADEDNQHRPGLHDLLDPLERLSPTLNVTKLLATFKYACFHPSVPPLCLSMRADLFLALQDMYLHYSHYKALLHLKVPLCFGDLWWESVQFLWQTCVCVCFPNALLEVNAVQCQQAAS